MKRPRRSEPVEALLTVLPMTVGKRKILRLRAGRGDVNLPFPARTEYAGDTAKRSDERSDEQSDEQNDMQRDVQSHMKQQRHRCDGFERHMISSTWWSIYLFCRSKSAPQQIRSIESTIKPINLNL